ncbi:MAG TPA: hypothetical protein VL147_09740 [Devosia sp.]|nr:hypothetical protein [Devosia sp.]
MEAYKAAADGAGYGKMALSDWTPKNADRYRYFVGNPFVENSIGAGAKVWVAIINEHKGAADAEESTT